MATFEKILRFRIDVPVFEARRLHAIRIAAESSTAGGVFPARARIFTAG
jgi:hypothetical protein